MASPVSPFQMDEEIPSCETTKCLTPLPNGLRGSGWSPIRLTPNASSRAGPRDPVSDRARANRRVTGVKERRSGKTVIRVRP